MNRYFIVFYHATIKGGGNFKGHSDVMTHDGGFVNRKTFIEDLAFEPGVTPTSVMITNVVELNESDYLDWYA